MKSFNIGDLAIPVPIIQGGMGIGISLSGLASAVANMGGVGVIATVGIGFLDGKAGPNLRARHIEAIRNEIRKARQQTSGILGVNIMSVITNFSDMVRTSIQEGIDIIFSGAGLPLDLPSYISKGVKTKLVPIISSGRAASLLIRKWKQNYDYLPDAFVVEGPKAGGHLGFKEDELNQESHSLENLLAEVLKVTEEVKEKKIPVIAAGGIFTGKDIHEILNKGAAAVQMGTRFVATEECDASPEFKNALVKASEEDVHIIKSPVGMPGRALYNNFLLETSEGKKRPSKCKYNCIRSCDPKTTSFCIANALLSAYHGKLEHGFVFTGSNAGRIQKITTVKELFSELLTEHRKAEEESS